MPPPYLLASVSARMECRSLTGRRFLFELFLGKLIRDLCENFIHHATLYWAVYIRWLVLFHIQM